MVECSTCHHENADAARFCSNCGGPLVRACPSCRHQASAEDRFCSACGTALSGPKKTTRSVDRRQAAILFCDLIGSTALSEQLEAEDLHELIGAYHELCAKAVQRYDGHVVKYLGDGVVAAFGFPAAHEDDSRRAVLTGLAILESLKELNNTVSKRFGVSAMVRIGIHTGLVIAGEMGSIDSPVMDIVGDTPNIAARMQEVANPNSLVVTSDTYRLIRAAFIFEYLGPRKLKGIAKEMECYRVLAPSSEEVGKGSRMVGRKEELSQLEMLWKRARNSQGRLALVRGDPGIGKSTLVNSILKRVRKDEDGAEVILNCSPYHQNTPFHPVIEYFRTTQMHLSRDDSAETQLELLEKFVVERGFEPAELVPILAPLLSIPFEHRYEPPHLSPEGRRIKTLEAVLNMTIRRTGQHAVALVIENIHWADPSTLELFGKILERLHGLRMLAIVTFRPYYTPLFPRPAGSVELSLDRLDHPAIWDLARQVAGGKDLPFEILDHIATKTDGVPLFVEELTKTILESGVVRLVDKKYELIGELKDLAIPTTLQGSLLARLERASGLKDIAQVAAVVGREFTLDVVSAVARVDEAVVSRQISNLVSADLVYQVEAFSGAKAYRFRHALIQDAAYDSLLRSARQQYHNDVANHLKSQSTDLSDGLPELIATHYTAAGAMDEALRWWSTAGTKALNRSANHEAIAHYTKGLELLDHKPESQEKYQLELEMLALRGTALVATQGFAAEEVGKTFRRAAKICQFVGDTPLLFPVTWGLFCYHHVRAEIEIGLQDAELMLNLATNPDYAAMAVEGHLMRGMVQFWLGQLEESKKNLDRAWSDYDPKEQEAHTVLFGQDPGVTVLCYLSFTYWALGLQDQARGFLDEAWNLAQRTKHPFTIGWALGFSCTVRSWRKDHDDSMEWSKRCREYCAEQGHPFWWSASIANIGISDFYSGRREQGLPMIRQGLAGFEGTGAIIMTPLWRGQLAEALIHVGQLEEALEVIDRGLATIEVHHEWVHEPFLRRLRGDIFVLQGHKTEAMSEYTRSFALAESQTSRMRALQTASAWLRLEPSDANRERLRRIYDQFTEGFDTEDLIHAKQLLDSKS